MIWRYTNKSESSLLILVFDQFECVGQHPCRLVRPTAAACVAAAAGGAQTQTQVSA